MSKPIIGIAIVMILVCAAIGYSIFGTATPGETTTTVVDPAVEEFAQCLTDKDVTFFGAFWCPHCQEQKKLFGQFLSKVKYVECSMPDGNSQTQTCKDQNITSYPTWQFADGSRVTGEQSLEALATKASCPFGANATSTEATTTPLQS